MSSSDKDQLHDRGKALEDLFFRERDQELLKRLKSQAVASDAQHALASAMGLTDQQALQSVLNIGHGMQVLTTMALLPLVQVAWCDGDVAPAERDAILKAAGELGIAEGTTIFESLKSWLAHKPSPEAVVAWKHYVGAVCQHLDSQSAWSLKRGLLDRAEKIAAAAGGFLGLGSKISPAERTCLDDLASAFPA